MVILQPPLLLRHLCFVYCPAIVWRPSLLVPYVATLSRPLSVPFSMVPPSSHFFVPTPHPHCKESFRHIPMAEQGVAHYSIVSRLFIQFFLAHNPLSVLFPTVRISILHNPHTVSAPHEGHQTSPLYWLCSKLGQKTPYTSTPHIYS